MLMVTVVPDILYSQAGAVGMMMMILIHQKCAAHAVVVKQLMLSLLQLVTMNHFHIIDLFSDGVSLRISFDGTDMTGNTVIHLHFVQYDDGFEYCYF